jgi:spermidine/putrescine transport system substrate-binding protein
MTSQLSRRTFNTLLGTTLVAAPWVRGARAATEITVLNWKGYGTDEAFAVKAFGEATGITVKHDYFNSEPEMLTKLRTNPGAHDVVLINTARTQQAEAEGLIDAIDYGAIANAKELAEQLKSHPNLLAGGKPYGVAWVWGMNSLGVRHGTVTDAGTWAIFSDPKYAGRLALFDDSTTEIGIGALLTGQDINDPKDLPAVGKALKGLKPNVKLLWSSEDQWNKAFSAGAFDISVYWSGAAVRAAKRHNLAVDFVVPKEGAIGWLDGLSVPSKSTKKEAALKFINYMIDAKFYVTWATTAGAPASANAAAMSQLPADDLNRQVHKPEYLSKTQFMAPLPDERRLAFNDLWEEAKAFYAK